MLQYLLILKAMQNRWTMIVTQNERFRTNIAHDPQTFVVCEIHDIIHY